MTQETLTQQDPAVKPPSNITLNDLKAMCTLIEVCSARGSFKPDEMVDVGTLYNKVIGFLKEVDAANAQAAPAPEANVAGPTVTQ